MLTLKDCIEFSGFDVQEIDAIAEHEHLPAMVALEKAAGILDQSWGAPALRQMIRDNIDRARANNRREHAISLEVVYRRACVKHPGGIDRRERSRQ